MLGIIQHVIPGLLVICRKEIHIFKFSSYFPPYAKVNLKEFREAD
jgi:hypothetical protein